MSGSVGQYTQGWLPWMGTKTTTGFTTRTADSSCLGMARLDSSNTQNDEMTWDIWLDAGTWKYSQVYITVSNAGIYSVQLDAVEQGTIDSYSAGTVRNVYSEVTGISVTVAGLKTFKLKMATKNASSSGYQGLIQSCAWIRTSGTSSIPAGTDTPGYTWHYLPWMGSKANIGMATVLQNSVHLGGGLLSPASPAQNNAVSWDIWLDAGTYKVTEIQYVSTDRGISSHQLNGSTQATIDGYSAGTTANTYAEVTGITVSTAGVKTYQLIMATKNASSTNYNINFNSVAWIRTGA